MKGFVFSLNTVFPLLVMMAAGVGARRLHWLGDSATRQANNCVYRLFLPLLLCFNIMDTQPTAEVNGTTLLFAFWGSLAVFLLMFWLAPRLCKQRNTRGVVIQGVARSNYAVFGIPLVLSMYPKGDTSVAAMMVVVVVPVFNVMSTIALMLHGQEKIDLGAIVKGILLNPLMLGTAAGFLLWRTGIRLPALLDTPLRRLADIATPLALFLLGASLDFGKAKAHLGLLVFSVAGRLALAPLLVLPLAVLLGFRDVSLATLIAVFASPTAVSSYPMAQQMGGDDDLAAAQVVFSTLFSILTVFVWVLAFRAMGFLA